jgi:aldehyde:ferredoxin oxidoreductase
MQLKGVMNKVAWVDLNTGQVETFQPEAELYRDYLGGYGLGAFYLYQRQPAQADPLGPENTLGLASGPLTGTQAITGNRFTAVGKSPKTGGWGDANCGGNFGPALKKAGLDAIFFSGVSPKPVYVLIEDGGVSLLEAQDLWGQGCVAVERNLKAKYGNKAHSVVIGPAGERTSLLACLINDEGRAAGRSGLGAVMGSKGLKAVVALGTGQVEVAQGQALKELRSQLIKDYYNKDNGIFFLLSSFGTPGVLEGGVVGGDTSIKNWGGSADDFPSYNQIDGDANNALVTKKYGCWRCPVACGAHVEVPQGPYAGKGHRPEYETLAAFGTSCLNDNLESICKFNNICNDAGMDTISAGSTVAFAIECYENGIINSGDTGGLELNWGNHGAMVELTEQMGSGTGFGGELLADGIKAAVAQLGQSAAPFAMQCGGEELPYHDPRAFPGLGMSYVADATPGRHTQFGAFYAEMGFVPPDLKHPEITDKYFYGGKGEAHKHVSSFGHVINMAGLCQLASCITPAPEVANFLSLAMGMPLSFEEMLTIGERAANLRIAFNLREGVNNSRDYKLPGRVLGNPPLAEGATKDVTVDNDTQVRDYFTAMGWNPDTGVPSKAAFQRLGLDFASEVCEG